MWDVEKTRVDRELGLVEVKSLEALRKWLYPSQVEPMKFRSAPSPVARSEAELFDISMPRFAFRAYLTPTSFVNARRIMTFAQMVVYWGEPPAGYDEFVDWERWKDAKKKPADIIRSASCIGDSLLQPPEKINEDRQYHVLKTKLGLAYGEHDEIEGVPFVRHIRLGGGMCGQAACFMATALMQQYEARGIYGVAEITALACDQDGPAIFINGISPDRMCNYFNHRDVGLSASRQYIQQHDQRALVRELGEALLSYCMSNMPVILRVDLGRMCGVEYRIENEKSAIDLKENQLFTGNKLKDLDTVKQCRVEGNKAPRPRPHAVLVVGCQAQRSEKESGGESLHFLINDPATYPFLKANASVLANIRHYDETHWNERNLGSFEFISVTPQAVRLPLLNVPNPRDINKPHMGLKDIAFNVLACRVVPNLKKLEFPAIPTLYGVETRLVDLKWCKEKGAANEDSRFHERAVHVPEDARKKLLDLTRKGLLPAKWCWIHCGPSNLIDGREIDSVFVWDATVPPPPQGTTPEQLMSKYLLAALTEDPAQENAEWKEDYIRPKAIKPALISSFHTGAMPDVRNEWPTNPKPATDLYVFMKLEVDAWLKRNGWLPGPPAGSNHPVAVMAQLAGDRGIIDKWAADVCESFPPEEIVAISSFVPEVTSPQPEAYEMACSAVQFLVEIAYALKGHGHKQLRTVELVMGSRIGGIWPSPGGNYSATRMDADEARHRMLSILGRVMSPYANIANDNRIALGIELEPGPLYLLHNWQSLVELCRQIDKDPLLSRFVGVNLDIAHWRLARDISPAQVWDAPEVRNRIVHAHISGHHRCIHGDLPLYDSNEAEDFRPWIELLHRIASDWRAPELPQFSGYVSVELEAAKEKNIVAESIKQLEDLL